MALHLIFLAMLVAAILAVLLPLARGAGRVGSAGVSALDLHRLRLALAAHTSKQNASIQNRGRYRRVLSRLCL